MATKKFLTEDGLVKYTGLVKKEIKTAKDGAITGLSPNADGNITVTKGDSTTSTLIPNDVTTTKHGLMTAADKVKLNGIATGAEVNVQSDWNVTDTTSDAYIKNKPTIDTALSSTSTNAVQNKVVKTEVDKKINASDLSATTGASKVGYTNSDMSGVTTVAGALTELKNEVDNISLDGDTVTVEVDGTNVPISSGDNLNDVVSAIDTAFGTTVDGQSIVNTTITSKYVDQAPVSDNKTYPVLLAGFDVTTKGQSATKSGTGASFDQSGLNFNPSTNTLDAGTVTASSTLRVGNNSNNVDGTTPSSLAGSVEINSSTITFKSGAIGTDNGTIDAKNYSGNAATATKATTADTATSATKATQDGDGNVIKDTYATKTALDALSDKLTGMFEIVTALPTADGTHGGVIFLIKDKEYGDTNSNIFKEYIEVKDGTEYKFELLGTTDAGVDVVSLTNDEIDTIWNTTAAAS